MEQDKADERDTEMSLRGEELDNVETVEMSSKAHTCKMRVLAQLI